MQEKFNFSKMLKVISFLIVIVIMVDANNRVENSLGLLLKDKQVEVSQGLVEERVTLIANLNITVTNLKPSFVSLGNAYKRFTDLAIFTDSGIKAEYGKAIESGRGHFQATQGILQDLYKGLDQAMVVTPESKCIFFMDVLNETTIITDTAFLVTKMAKISTTMGPADLKDEKLAVFERFIASYNRIAADWYSTAERQAANWNMLLNGNFPEGLLAQLEQISCLEKSKYESVDILDCKECKQGLICELNVQIPSYFKTYDILREINYKDTQIATPKGNYKFAQIPESTVVVWLECSPEEIRKSEVISCREHEIEKECAHAIQHEVIEKMLTHCSFTKVKPELAVRLHDNGVLVQGIDVIIRENGKSIFHDTPLVIYTNYDLIISLLSYEVTIVANTITQNPRIISTILTEEQIESMESKAWWGDIVQELGWEDYLEYVSLMLEVILLPLTLLGIGLSLRMKYRKHGNKRDKNVRKNNYRETRAMMRDQ